MFGFDQDMVFRIPALLIALTVHEYAHARVAVALGDPTPRYMGRLTLNPVAHLDPIGLLMLWLFKFGWAKPVPVNPSYFRDGRKGMIAVSLAGPGSNIALAFLAGFVYALAGKLGLSSVPVDKILQLTILYNVFFGVFNLMPVPPLDGFKILTGLLPGREAYQLERFESYGTMILIGLVLMGAVGWFTDPITRMILRSIDFVIRLLY